MSKATSVHDIGSAFDLLGKSYEIVKRNWQAYAVTNIFALLAAVIALFPDDNKKVNENNYSAFLTFFDGTMGSYELGAVLGAGFIILLVLAVVNLFLYTMLTALQTKNSKDESPSISELFEDGKKFFFPLLGLSILMILIIAAGAVLLIVPGIIAIKRLIYAPYIMIDQKLGIMDSLKESNLMSITYSGKTWGVVGVFFLIAVATGIIGKVPYIGELAATLAAIAFSVIVALRYRQLKDLKHSS